MIKPNFLAIVPARGGSKGIPHKNLVNLGNRPLIDWTLDACIASKYIQEVIVSSDSSEILQRASRFNFTAHERSDELSGDLVQTSEVINSVLKFYEHLQHQFSHFILLQPTSPLRTATHIDEACNNLLANKASSLISVHESDNTILKSLILDDQQKLSASFIGNFFEMPRQSLPRTFKPNGAIYISEIPSYIGCNSFLQENTIPYHMDEESSTDIDTPNDLLKTENILKNKK